MTRLVRVVSVRAEIERAGPVTGFALDGFPALEVEAEFEYMGAACMRQSGVGEQGRLGAAKRKSRVVAGVRGITDSAEGCVGNQIARIILGIELRDVDSRGLAV